MESMEPGRAYSDDHIDNVKAAAEKNQYGKKLDRMIRVARIGKYSMLVGLCFLTFWPLVALIWWIITGDTSIAQALGNDEAPSPEYARCLGAAALFLVGGCAVVFVAVEKQDDLKNGLRYGYYR